MSHVCTWNHQWAICESKKELYSRMLVVVSQDLKFLTRKIVTLYFAWTHGPWLVASWNHVFTPSAGRRNLLNWWIQSPTNVRDISILGTLTRSTCCLGEIIFKIQENGSSTSKVKHFCSPRPCPFRKGTPCSSTSTCTWPGESHGDGRHVHKWRLKIRLPKISFGVSYVTHQTGDLVKYTHHILIESSKIALHVCTSV